MAACLTQLRTAVSVRSNSRATWPMLFPLERTRPTTSALYSGVKLSVSWHSGMPGDPKLNEWELVLVLADRREPLTFHCAPDEPPPEDASDEDKADNMGPLKGLCFSLVTFAERNGLQVIVDEEDDRHFIRNDVIAAVEVPVFLFGEVEETDGDEEAEAGDPVTADGETEPRPPK
jgi:hypothetical protein